LLNFYPAVLRVTVCQIKES